VVVTEDGAGEPTIIIEPTTLAGVWANAAEVTPSPHEFTLDFVRMDYSLGTPLDEGSSSRGLPSRLSSSCA
jgi:hypothetical protein